MTNLAAVGLFNLIATFPFPFVHIWPCSLMKKAIENYATLFKTLSKTKINVIKKSMQNLVDKKENV